MDTNDNPYAPPNAVFEFVPTAEPRNVSYGMVGFPYLLGGCTSVLLGTKHDSWMSGIPQRFLKGLVAGFVLGFVYAVLLNVIGAFMLSDFSPTVADYSSMMWRAGTIAMMVGSGLYFMLFHWSAGLHPHLQAQIAGTCREAGFTPPVICTPEQLKATEDDS